jgi:hypothetical protein
MIRMPKSDLQEATNIFILANTPKSLLRGLLKSNVVNDLRRRCSVDELRVYFDTVTERGERSPFVAALAYAVLIALLTKSPPSADSPDATRLQWGPIIKDYLIERFPVTETRIITTDTPQATVTYTSSSPRSLSLGRPQSGRSILNV